MRSCALLAGLTLALLSGLIAAKAPAAGVTLDKALAMSAAELAATCNRAAASRKYVELARAGATVNLGGRRVTASNADAVAADIDAQLEVCRAAVAQRGVADVAGAWRGTSAGCERAGSLLAEAVREPATIVRFTQDGISMTMTLSGRTGDGQEFSLDAPGTVVDHYVAVRDPVNSDYLMEGEVTEAGIVFRPDARSILAAWPAWANPPKASDLSTCVVTLHRSSEPGAAVGEPQPH